MRLKKGFTLIELLIVVAIIAILAAIAIPNFLEAQTRAKVSRAKSDLRTFVTALESYRVDNNGYPPYGETDPPIWQQGTNFAVLKPQLLTTPIAYLTSEAGMEDPFRLHVAGTTWWARFYNYVNWDDVRYKNTAFVHERYGEWRLTCAGPDGWYWNRFPPNHPSFPGSFAVIPYDPTNGTVSVGDIIRTQKDIEFNDIYM